MAKGRKKEARQVVHLRVERELYEVIARRAEEEERSVNSVIERALREHFQPRRST